MLIKTALYSAMSLVLATVSASLVAQTGKRPTAILSISRIGLPGEGRGDFITADVRHNLLFVTHSSRVHVLDLKALKELAEVQGLKTAHGVAIDGSGKRGFVTDGGENAVVMFDPASGKSLKSIPAGKTPDSILWDGFSGRILAFNGGSSDLSVIDPAAAAVVKTIKLPSDPEAAVADGRGDVWVTMEDANAIAEIDTKTMRFVRSIPLRGCKGPTPLALDTADRRLFSGCGNKIMLVTDADSGKTVASVPIGGGPDGIAYDPATERIFVANRDGAWTIVRQTSADSYFVERALKIDEYAKTIAFDPTTHRIFSSTADLVWPADVPGKKYLPNAKLGTFRLMVVSQNLQPASHNRGATRR
jgi:DNA-binding beta-propeller fold protein YncE